MKEFVRKRLDKAGRALAAARREVSSGNPDFAIERVYYAMFYAADALLAHHDLRYRSHGAVHGAFGRHLVKTGMVEATHHRALLDAFEARQLATYGVEAGITTDQAQLLIDRADAFIDAVRQLIEPFDGSAEA